MYNLLVHVHFVSKILVDGAYLPTYKRFTCADLELSLQLRFSTVQITRDNSYSYMGTPIDGLVFNRETLLKTTPLVGVPHILMPQHQCLYSCILHSNVIWFHKKNNNGKSAAKQGTHINGLVALHAAWLRRS